MSVWEGRTVPPALVPWRVCSPPASGQRDDPLLTAPRRAWSSLPGPGLRSLRPVPWTRTGRSSLRLAALPKGLKCCLEPLP